MYTYSSAWECRALAWECRALAWECRALAWECRALAWECRALAWECRAPARHINKILLSKKVHALITMLAQSDFARHKQRKIFNICRAGARHSQAQARHLGRHFCGCSCCTSNTALRGAQCRCPGFYDFFRFCLRIS